MPATEPNVKAPTRQRLVEAAATRFYRDGFRNVGIDQILADVGISKTAFYKHFESKDDLMLAVLETKNAWLQSELQKMISRRGGPDAADQLRGLFDVVEEIIASEEFHGCIFVNAVMEFPLQHDPAHRAAAQHKLEIEAIVREIASLAGVADPAALAQELCLIMEGSYVTRVVTGSPRAIDIARRLADHALNAHLPSQPTHTVNAPVHSAQDAT
jgi:AcrR family transcriptional regulator